jgi:hypothetical protein
MAGKISKAERREGDSAPCTVCGRETECVDVEISSGRRWAVCPPCHRQVLEARPQERETLLRAGREWTEPTRPRITAFCPGRRPEMTIPMPRYPSPVLSALVRRFSRHLGDEGRSRGNFRAGGDHGHQYQGLGGRAKPVLRAC